MKEETKINEAGSKSVLVPFLLGGLVGAGVMLLLAPKSGKEIRKDLSDAATNAGNRIASAVDKGKALYEKNKSAITEAIDAGKTAYLQEKKQQQQAA